MPQRKGNMVYRHTILAGVSLSVLMTPLAMAQEEERAMDTIVVTAQKREAAIQDISASIQVLSGDAIAERSIANFEDLSNELAGVSMTADFGGSASTVVSIRGVGGTDDYRPNGSPSVAMHVDNIYQSSNAFLVMPFFDVERAEVLKGPQGTLYGRNSTAGVVNIISRSDSDELNGYVTGQYESYDRFRGEAAVGIPLSDRVGIRIAGVVDQGGGYQDGMGAGYLGGVTAVAGTPAIPDPGEREGWGDRDLFAGRVTLNAELTDVTDLQLRVFKSEDNGETLYPDSVGGVSNSGWVEPDNDPYTFYSHRYGEREMSVEGVSANFSHAFSDALDLDIVAGYQTADRYIEGEGTGSAIRIFDYNFSDSIEQTSFEARLSNNDGGAWDWVAGIYYLDDTVDFRTDLLAEDAYATVLVSDYHQNRTSQAMFGQADFYLSEQFTLTTGIRYTDDEADYVGSTTDADPYGASLVPYVLPVVPVYFDESLAEDNVSGRITLSYQPNEAWNIWASVGNGYKAGGFDGSTIFSEAEALPFESETVTAYEAGFKFAGSNGTYLNVDAFLYQFDNLQANTVSIIEGQETSANVRTNVAEAESYGLDIAGGTTLFEQGAHSLWIDGSATLLESEILDFESVDPDQVAINEGNSLPASPNLSGNIGLTYVYTSSAWEVSTSLYARYKGSEYKRLNNDPGTETPSYTILNARAELEMFDPSVTFFAFANNLTDETYFLDYGATARLVGKPRIFGVGARYNF
ncbi:MAG: hypothetical protein CBB65_10955 [Hyphomonadaceae bacterium TMED5]|nr:TonB-dependent receptor [Ponticaulis sp.]OUX98295.1 MAG: hypothetical protein CBB65_10955 [Hyphomonadaceae bacterium TMED5]